ncbi:hypothetical protein KIP88_16740 [Bradyrhizobium sp. SRL28]|uniref:hypothetical protein n=1 Tax=Bradyrhizobium sp. SRL28 TaxID=2836178 RepID=UPI001BDF28AF|nr:hypothetical protein [Bradyrhizobium sp. SRL28]MBT1512151.1 hypothetical protein [Bradyrhizobium sp. SRL28]
MTAHGQQRFAEFVSEFIDGSGIEPPLYVIAIGSNGAVSVSRHANSDVKQRVGKGAQRRAHHLSPLSGMVGTLRFAHPTAPCLNHHKTRCAKDRISPAISA